MQPLYWRDYRLSLPLAAFLLQHRGMSHTPSIPETRAATELTLAGHPGCGDRASHVEGILVEDIADGETGELVQLGEVHRVVPHVEHGD